MSHLKVKREFNREEALFLSNISHIAKSWAEIQKHVQATKGKRQSMIKKRGGGRQSPTLPYSEMNTTVSFWGWMNSYSNVRRNPSSKEYGGTKPDWSILSELNSVVAQNFFTLTELTESFRRVKKAKTSKQYPPNIPNQYGKWVVGMRFFNTVSTCPTRRFIV